MSKELVIELRIPLSGEMFKDSETVLAAKNIHSDLEAAATAALGGIGYTLSVDTKETRAARAPRSDAGVPRQSRKGKPAANGADTIAPPPATV